MGELPAAGLSWGVVFRVLWGFLDLSFWVDFGGTLGGPVFAYRCLAFWRFCGVLLRVLPRGFDSAVLLSSLSVDE
mgnify:FL=1